MSYLIYTDLNSSLLDAKLIDPGWTLVRMASLKAMLIENIVQV